MTDHSLELSESPDLEPYRRGLAIGPVLSGVFSRFLPGSLIGAAGLALIFDLSARGDDVATAGVILGLGLVMTLGYGATLLGMRRWLFPDARPDRLRSFLAGLAAPFVVLLFLLAGLDFAYLPVVAGVAGIVCALGLFFAWLTPTPKEMRDPEYLDEANPDTTGQPS